MAGPGPPLHVLTPLGGVIRDAVGGSVGDGAEGAGSRRMRAPASCVCTIRPVDFWLSSYRIVAVRR
eukprot:1094078-Prymnesium_polylepis.1